MTRIAMVTAVLVMILLLFRSCSDEESTNLSPKVRVIQPGQCSHLTIPDSVYIAMECIDEDLRSVSLSLINTAKTPVAKSMTYYPKRDTFSLQTYFPVTDTLLGSGTYFIRITASDNENTFTQDLKLMVHGVPRKVQGYIMIGADNQTTQIQHRDADFRRLGQKGITLNYYSSAFYSAAKLLFVEGLKTHPLTAFHVDKITQAWYYDIASSQDHHAADEIVYSDKELIASFYSKKQLIAFTKEGKSKREILMDENFFPGKMALSDRYLFLERVNYGFTLRKLGMYYRETFGEAESYDIPASEVFDMVAVSDDTLFLATQQNGEFRLLLFQPANNIFSVRTKLDEKPVQIILRNNNSLLMRTEHKVWHYIIREDVLYTIYDGATKAMRYDSTEDRVFILTPHHLKAVSASLGSQLNSFPLQEEFTDFHLFYNR